MRTPRRDEQAARILEAMDRIGDWMYALDISADAGLPGGSIYSGLVRLELAGWIESRWEPDPPVKLAPGRRQYRVKPR